MTLPNRMKAVSISAPGGPEVLQLTERPVPQPGAQEVLIKVAAAGVNGPDLMQRKGLYPPPAGASDLPGLEVSGEVVAAGRSADRRFGYASRRLRHAVESSSLDSRAPEWRRARR